MAFQLNPNVQIEDYDCLSTQPILPDRLRTPPESVNDIRDTLLCALETAAKYTLFEFNDRFTRAQAECMIEPCLKDCVNRKVIDAFELMVESDPMDLRIFVGLMLESNGKQYRIRAIIRHPEIISFDFELI